MTILQRPLGTWCGGAAFALLLFATSPVQAEDFSITLAESSLNAFAAAAGPIGDSGTYDVVYQYPCTVCTAEYNGMCLGYTYGSCDSTMALDWSWEVASAQIDVSTTGISVKGTIRVVFDGQVSVISFEKPGAAIYLASSNSILLVFDFLTETKVPVYGTRFGESHLLGSVSPFKYYNAIIPLGTANVSVQGSNISGDLHNVQVILQNNQLRIQSEISFNG